MVRVLSGDTFRITSTRSKSLPHTTDTRLIDISRYRSYTIAPTDYTYAKTILDLAVTVAPLDRGREQTI
jgi:hypothetical protein